MEEKKKTKTDPRQIGYAKKYDAKHDCMNMRFPKGTKEKIISLGYSSAAKFVQLAVAEKIAREEELLGK